MSVFDKMLVELGYDSPILPPHPVNEILTISDDTIVSRNTKGEVVSRFGDDYWDFSAISAQSTAKWGFNKSEFPKAIQREIKLIQYARFYWAPKARSVTSIVPKNVYKLARWAVKNGVSIEQMLNDERLYPYVASSLSKVKRRGAEGISATVTELVSIRLINAHFKVAPSNHELSDILIKIKDSIPKERIKQTEVIPTRIYAELISCFGDSLNEFNDNFKHIHKFFFAIRDGFGFSANFISDLKKRNEWEGFLKLHGVYDLAVKYDLGNKKEWNVYLRNISEEAKYWIHLFTGMRNTEVNTLEYNCLSDLNTTGVPTKIIRGYTSKTLGSGATATYWVTNEIIDRAVTVSQNYGVLCAIDNIQYQVDDFDYPLFPQQQPQSKWNSNNSFHKYAPFSKGFGQRKRFNEWLSKYPGLVVTESDMSELRLYDGFRDWESDIIVGKLWPLSTHQCRRSLAVYMARSGMVSIGSLQLQFKHLLSAMTSYYRKNSVFAKNFIMNDEEDEFHRNQILFMNTIEQEQRVAQFLDYEEDVIENQANLWGGEGTRIRRAFEKGAPLVITTDRKKTQKRFMQGEMAYKRGPVGGCTNVGSCDKLSISNPVPCFECSKSVLDSVSSIQKGKQALKNLYKTRDKYEPDSLHYHQAQADIELLENNLKQAEALFND